MTDAMDTRQADHTDANGFTGEPGDNAEPFDPIMMDRINTASVSAVAIRRYVRTCGAKRRRNDPDYNFGMQMLTAAERMRHDRVRTLALFLRARALSLIATDEGLPRWAFDNADALFNAAAIETMSRNADGEIVFDRERFLSRVFQFAAPDVWLH